MKVGKVGGLFSDLAGTFTTAKDFTSRQLDTVIDVSGSIKGGASTVQDAISGKPKTTEVPSSGVMSSISSIPPIAWVGIVAALAFVFSGKKR